MIHQCGYTALLQWRARHQTSRHCAGALVTYTLPSTTDECWSRHLHTFTNSRLRNPTQNTTHEQQTIEHHDRLLKGVLVFKPWRYVTSVYEPDCLYCKLPKLQLIILLPVVEEKQKWIHLILQSPFEPESKGWNVNDSHQISNKEKRINLDLRWFMIILFLISDCGIRFPIHDLENLYIIHQSL